MSQRIFSSFDEAIETIRAITDKYQKDVQIYTKGKAIGSVNKLVTFIVLVQPMENYNFDLKDELILLKAKGWAIEDVSWQPKFSDQVDIMFEIIEITAEVKTFEKK